MTRENQIADAVFDVAFKIHTQLGPGLFESVYETIMERELLLRGFEVRRQMPVPVVWNDEKLEDGFRVDLLVGGLVIVEIKSVEALADVHFKQVLTYVRLADRRLGLLINFNVPLLKDGIKRIANRMPS